VASILLLLRRVANPHVAFLGRIPGTSRFSDLARHPDNERIGGILAFRVEASLLYFNVGSVLETVRARLQGDRAGVRLVICDLSTSPYVDLAGARMLRDLGQELAKEASGCASPTPVPRRATCSGGKGWSPPPDPSIASRRWPTSWTPSARSPRAPHEEDRTAAESRGSTFLASGG
jgi:STAS domain-containing protein